MRPSCTFKLQLVTEALTPLPAQANPNLAVWAALVCPEVRATACLRAHRVAVPPAELAEAE